MLALTRRRLLSGAAVVPFAAPLVLSGCSTEQVQAAETDLVNIINDFENEAATLAATVGIDATTQATIQSYIDQLKAFVTGVGDTLLDTSTSTIQKILTLIGKLLAILQAVSALLPAPIPTILSAIALVLPTVEAAFALVGTATTPAATALHRFAAAAPMSLQKARLTIALYALKQ